MVFAVLEMSGGRALVREDGGCWSRQGVRRSRSGQHNAPRSRGGRVVRPDRKGQTA
jgi:hypothetical protein